jgi:ribosomal protein L7Ae-like RNA K-turn-binding protein
MSEASLGMLGLGVRAGTVVLGTSGVRAQIQRGQTKLVVVASDHGARTEEKVLRLARARQVPTLVGPRADRLGHRVGRHSVQAVGVADASLAAGIIDSASVKSRRQ